MKAVSCEVFVFAEKIFLKPEEIQVRFVLFQLDDSSKLYINTCMIVLLSFANLSYNSIKRYCLFLLSSCLSFSHSLSTFLLFFKFWISRWWHYNARPRRCQVYIPVKVIHWSRQTPEELLECKVCAVAEKTLVCYKGDIKPIQQTNKSLYLSLP